MTITGGPTRTKRRFKVMLVDLDDTLYRVHQIPAVVRQRIQEYMVQKLGVPEDKVAALTMELYLQHGTTLAGLVASGHHIRYDDWHQHVHWGAIDYHLLQPDPSLRELLCSIDIPKYILTNADKKHTEICLARLGISDCFQGQFYFENVMEVACDVGISTAEHPAVLCKPNPAIYKYVAQKLGVDLADVMFLDDSVRNVSSARELGAYTVLVGTEAPCPGAHLSVATLHQLPQALPELFDQPGDVKVDTHHAAARVLAVQQPELQPVAIPAVAS